MNNSCIFKKVVMMFLLLVGTLNIYSQHVVTGRVIDHQDPLIGASVTVKDVAVSTDIYIYVYVRFLIPRQFWFIRISVTLIRRKRLANVQL